MYTVSSPAEDLYLEQPQQPQQEPELQEQEHPEQQEQRGPEQHLDVSFLQA